MYRYVIVAAAVGLSVIVGAPASAAPLDAVTASLETDPVYVAPGSIARFDQARVRRELAGSRVAVVVQPFLTDSDDDEQVEKLLDEWSAANDRPLVRVTGLQVRMASTDQWFAPGPADYRDLLERYDVTREVVRAVRHLRGAPALHEPWRPTVVAPEPAQVAAIVAGLKASRAYQEPGADGVDLDTMAARLTGEPPYRVVTLKPLAGDREPDLLPALAAAFPGELIIVVRGSWLTATGLPPRRIAAGQAAQVTAGSLAHGSSASDAVDNFLRRVMSFERTPEKRPVDSGIDSGRTIVALAPWVFLLVTVLVGGGSLMFWARRTGRERRAAATSLATSGAETQSRLAKLGADLHDLDPGDDLIAARRLADAAERYATARDLHDRADTPEEFEAVIATLVEGEAYTDVVRDRLGLPIRGAACAVSWVATLLRWTWIGGMIFGATVIVASLIGWAVVSVIVEDDPMRVALADDSVYVDKSARKILDADAARRVVGDRSIVVVAVAGADYPAGTCELAVWDRNIALGIVYSDVSTPALCAGRFAETPDTMTGAGWATQIHLAGQFARMDEPYSAIADLTAFVAAYDTAVDADLRYGRPPGSVQDRTGSWKEVAWVLVALAVIVWIAYVYLVEGGEKIAVIRDRRRRRRVLRAELQAEMASVAAALSGEPAGEGFARAVQRYRWAEESSAEHPEMARIWVRQAREALDAAAGEAR